MKSSVSDSVENDPESSLTERFVCPLCEEGLVSGEHLQTHMLKHEGEQPSFKCDVCSKVCPDAATFGSHLRLHTGERPFKCEQCGKSFREKCGLTRHARTHTGEKPFRCEICYKSFTDQGSYRRHQKNHMGDIAKVHKCPFQLCDKAFKDRSSLKRHCKVHTGEKPFICQVCSRCFTESGSYKRHERVHTGEKRYACRACNRLFSERASMLRHERNVCRLTPRQKDSDNDPQSSLPLESSPCSLTDLYRSYISKSSDVLNNNVQTSLEGENDTGFFPHSTSKAQSMAANGDGIGRDSTPSFESMYAALRKSADGHSIYGEEGDFNAAGCQGLQEYSRGVDKWPAVEKGDGTDSEWVQGESSDDSSTVLTTPKNDALDRIRNVAPRMLETHHFVETKQAENGDPDCDAQMCFECGDMLSDDDDENRSTSDSVSTVSDSHRRRCRTCRQEMVSFGTEESLPSLADCAALPLSPSLTDNCQKPVSMKQETEQMIQFLSSFIDQDRQNGPTRHDPLENVQQNGPTMHNQLENVQYRHPTGCKHTCLQCDKTFRDSSKLKRHYRIHLNQRNFVCTTCGKRFIEASSLRRHESVHSDVKPHNCTACGKGYTDSSGLKKHLVRCKAQVRVKVEVEDSSGAVGEVKVEEGGSPREVNEAVKLECDGSEEGVAGSRLESQSLAGRSMADASACVTYMEGSHNTLADQAEPPLSQRVSACSDSQQQDTASHSGSLQHTSTPPYVFSKNGKSSEGGTSVSQGSLTDLTSGSVSVDMKQAVYCPFCMKLFITPPYLDNHIRKHHSEVENLCCLPRDMMEAVTTLTLLKKRGCSQVSTGNPSEVTGVQALPGSSQVADRSVMSGDALSQSTVPMDTSQSSNFLSATIPSSMKGLSPVQAFPAATSLSSLVDTSAESAELPSCETATEESSAAVSYECGVSENHKSAHAESSVPTEFSTQTEFTPPPSSLSRVLKRSCSVEAASPTISLTPSHAGSHVPCEVCSKVFADSSSLKRHARVHTDQQQQYACDNCDKVFFDQGSLKRHSLHGCKNVSRRAGDGEIWAVRTVEEGVSAEEGFACTQCQMVFATREDQMTHEKEHRVTPSLRCTVCRKSFSDAATLQRHLLVHASERPYTCDVCCKGFADGGSLSKHHARGCYAHASVVLDSSKLPCADCGKVFSDRSNFSQHQASHRGGSAKLKPYPCDHCSKSFADSGSLKRHRRLHTGQNLCRCLQCGRTFLENSGLKKHLQRRSCPQDKKKAVAAKAWLFPCTQCDKVFTKRYILLRHMKTHLGLRPFACDKCDKTFTESSSLKRHYRHHTGERPYWCEGCHKAFADVGVLKKHKQRCVYSNGLDEDERSASPLQPESVYLFNGSSFGRKFAGHLKAVASKSFCSGGLSKSATPGGRSELSASPGRLSLRSKDCWRCGRSFPSLEARVRHSKAVHAGTWSFPCRRCWQRFPRLPYLRVHNRQHHPVCNQP